MNVITVKLRHPTIPKAPRAAKIILGGPKPRGRCGVSYCCRVTQALGTPTGSRGECSRSASSSCSLLSSAFEWWRKPPRPHPISNSGRFFSHSKSLGSISMAMVPLGPGAFRETVGSANSIPLHSALIAATVRKEVKRKRNTWREREVIIACRIMYLVLSRPRSHLLFSLLDCVTLTSFKPHSRSPNCPSLHKPATLLPI